MRFCIALLSFAMACTIDGTGAGTSSGTASSSTSGRTAGGHQVRGRWLSRRDALARRRGHQRGRHEGQHRRPARVQSAAEKALFLAFYL